MVKKDNSKVASNKKVPAVKKEESKKEIKKGARVRLTQAHLILEPGEYEVESISVNGDLVLKSVKGSVHVPLEKIEVISPLSKEQKEKAAVPASDPAKDKKQGQMEMPDPNADKDFYIDPSGQMTINKIDTPMGKLAQRIIRADIEINKIKSECDRQIEKIMRERSEDEAVMMSEMKKLGSKKITVLGKIILYKLGKPTHDCLEIKDQK